MAVNVLVTSAGRRGQLVQKLQEDLAQVSPRSVVLAADASNLAAAGYLANASHLVPRVDSGEYAQALLDLCRTESISLLIPTIDSELRILSECGEEFRNAGCSISVSNPETIAIAMNKLHAHRWLLDHSFPSPQTWSEGENVMGRSGRKIEVVLKPVEGSRSVGIDYVSVSQSGLIVPPNYIAQEWIEGEEFTISTYVNSEGECVVAVPRLRIEVRDGEVSKGRTVRDDLLQSLAKGVVENLPEARGPLNVQVIRQNGTGKLFVIEINPRFGGGDPLAWAAGANIPGYLLGEALGKELPNLDSWRDGVTMLRFDQAVYLDSDGAPFKIG